LKSKKKDKKKRTQLIAALNSFYPYIFNFVCSASAPYYHTWWRREIFNKMMVTFSTHAVLNMLSVSLSKQTLH